MVLSPGDRATTQGENEDSNTSLRQPTYSSAARGLAAAAANCSARLYGQMQQILTEDLPYFWLIDSQGYRALSWLIIHPRLLLTPHPRCGAARHAARIPPGRWAFLPLGLRAE